MLHDQLPTNDEAYPSEIHRLLKLPGHLIVPGGLKSSPPQDLPAVSIEPQADHSDHVFATSPKPVSTKQSHPAWVEFMHSNFIVYPAVFLVAFLFFYSLFNFQAVTSQVSGWFAKAEDRQILGKDLEAYYAWISGYYYAVGDRAALEPNADIDRDGLSNWEEFVLGTNPTLADSNSNGISDGIEVLNGTNYWGSGPLTEKQRKLVDQLDLIKINNRINFYVAANNANPQILGASKINYNLNREGRLSVPKLGIQVPIIWTKDPADFDVDLTRGVVHYPGTALPGEQGTVYISGHSSDYPWKKHPYKQVFARLNALDPGDNIFIDIYGANGQLYNYRYRVTDKNIYKPDDQTQFIDNSLAKLNLSTCWPIGTAKDRYVVSAVLEGV